MRSSELALRFSIFSSAVSLVALLLHSLLSVPLVVLAVKVSSFSFVAVLLLKIASGCLWYLCPCPSVLSLHYLMIVVRYLHIPASIGRRSLL